jgi:hypothetical protein
MEIPENMNIELAAWNNGEGIDLRAWIACAGNFSLAVGYAYIFWPEFEEFNGYILRKGFSQAALAGFECQSAYTSKSVEWVMNHLHLADIQYFGCEDISKDKILVLGNILKEIYEAKLASQFPDKPCIVEFYKPEDEEDLMQYQLSFWQTKHE